MLIARSFVLVALALPSAGAAAQGSISGTVYDSLSARGPLANAMVMLVERSRYATTDAQGRFKFDGLPDGRYTIGFTHPVLDSLDLELPPVPIVLGGDHKALLQLATPSAATAYAAICPGAHEAESGVIMGRVRDIDDHAPLAEASIGTEWTDYTIAAGRASGHRVRTTVKASRGGVYLLCGVPTKVPLDVSADFAGFSAGPVELTLDDRLIRRLDFGVSRRDSAAHGSATLRGVVRGADGQPLRDAVVEVVGTLQSARTDAKGSFVIAGIPAGTRSIEIRSIGFLPERHTVDLATKAVRSAEYAITHQAQELKADTVKAAAKIPSVMEGDGFEDRRKHALGAYLVASEIARHQYPDLGTVLGEMRGVHLERDRFGKAVPRLNGTIAGYCQPNIYLDGTLFIQSISSAGINGPTTGGSGGGGGGGGSAGGSAGFANGRSGGGQRVSNGGSFDDLSLIARPDLIKGIEVYTSPGTIPAQYDMMSSTGCGSIVIWTR